MMKTKNKFGWFVIISSGFSMLVIFVLAVLFWHQLSLPEKQLLKEIFTSNFIYIFSAGFILLAGLGFLIDWMFRLYIIPISKLSEEVALIYAGNPSHRIDIEGSLDFMRLVEQINVGADKHEALKNRVLERINIAKKELEEEKNILAAIMAELPEAVIICNSEGRIILYNTRAKRFFNEHTALGYQTNEGAEVDDSTAGYEEKKFLGIGRSIFSLVDKNILQHAIEEMHARLERQLENTVASFVLTAKGGRLLRAELVPILTVQRAFSGFIMICEDITLGLRNEVRAEFLMRSFKNKIRHSIASIRSAIDLVAEDCEMDASPHASLIKIIHKESSELSLLVQNDASKNFKSEKKLWPLVPVSASKLLATFKEKAEKLLSVSIKTTVCKEESWVKVDSYTVVLSLLFVLQHIIEESGETVFLCGCAPTEKFVYLDILWQGEPVKIEKLRKWESEQLKVKREGLPLYLREVLSYNSAEFWSYADRENENFSCMRLYLPLHRFYQTDMARYAAVLPDSRPEFYNFDLFNQPGQNPDQDQSLLRDLVFTVFDTETTGLDPGAGDRIISIGAVRIVNLRMLKDESFDQLINPQRDIPAASTKIHGIDDDMVNFKPGIDKILPMFYQFAFETILVAHNAAFDMRMLQIYEAQTGIKFINPVLDTLLLSAVVHPNQDDHSIESIADRFGVEIQDRHTAMGDALLTGKIFIKLIPLLESMGIQTLKAAREASEKTYYARLKY
jgi:DNA polymerase-3 subunit epsilon